MEYSWFTVFQVYSEVIQLNIYIYILFQMLFHYRLSQDIEYCSVLYSMFLLFICYLYSDVYLLTPNI